MAFRFFPKRKKKFPAGAEEEFSYYDDIYSLELPPEGLRKLKRIWLALSLAASAIFVAVNVVPSALSLNGVIGLLCILTLIPWVEHWHGLIRVLLNQREELRFTLYRVTYRRFERGARGVLFMLCLTLLVELLFLRQGSVPLWDSALYWAGTAVCVGLLWAVVFLLKRHPARVVRRQVPAVSEKGEIL